MIKTMAEDLRWTRKLGLFLIVALSPLMMGANACGLPTAADFAAPQSAEAFCATTFPSVGFGNFFYCGTSQGNTAAGVAFPDGAHGYVRPPTRASGWSGIPSPRTTAASLK